MTPKEKAKHLVDKFIQYSYFSDANNSMNRGYQREDNAKQCALIAVVEIYKLKLNIGQHLEEFEDKANYYSYWEEVKNEIEKL